MSIPNSQIAFGEKLKDNIFSDVANEKAREVYDGGLKKDRD